MKTEPLQELVRILLVEDNPGDVRLIKEALKGSQIPSFLTVAEDGQEAFAILRQGGPLPFDLLPDLILLDLNLPKKHGCEVLADLKADPKLNHIPVVILTSSRSEEDVRKSYENQASFYITKPADLTQLVDVVLALDNFWMTFLKLSRGDKHED